MLRIFTILGQEVRTLVDGVEDFGYELVMWNVQNNMGEPVTPGVHMYKLEAGEFVSVKKMVIK